MAYQWTTPIRFVRGLGPTKAKELNNIKINTVGDLLEYQPLHYIYPGSISIAEAKEGYVVIKAKIKGIKWAGYTHSTPMVAILEDSTGTCKAEWYNQYHALQNLCSGMTVTFWGKFKGGVLQQPKWTTVESSMDDIYGGQYGVHNATIRAALKEVLINTDLGFMHNGCVRISIYNEFHFPQDKSHQQWALKALKFDECLMLQLALAERKKGVRQHVVPSMNWDDVVNTEIMSYFTYRFTQDQNNAILNIIGNMTGLNCKMSRLLHGEVGSGKTAVAFYAAMLAALNNKRTLILCPTTILAQQHYDTLKGMGWDDVMLYTGVDSGYFNGKYPGGGRIVIGTHALLNQPKLLKSASLVIIDEFQKFGVQQRAKIQKHNPHLLLVSATPIPRTLAASVFGNLDVSTIRQLPIKRGPVVTRWVLPEKREAMYEIVEQELAKGHQAYVVYPRIGNEEQEISAIAGFTQLCVSRFPHHNIHMLIGRYSTKNKAEALRAFKTGETNILVSTIIAEVGLDNPNATVMVIEGADRFGLSQLHQLRGRICRSTDIVFCFLVSETANQTSIDRLEVIEKCNDGFEIAEHDLRLRGPGELFSTRQHGLPDLKFASLVDDYDLMVEACDLVQSGDVGNGVREMMELKYGDNLSLGEVK